MSGETSGNRPTQTFRMGLIEAAIWTNHEGRHNVTFQRSYKQGDQWKTTTSFNAQDIPVIECLARRVEHYLLSLNIDRSSD